MTKIVSSPRLRRSTICWNIDYMAGGNLWVCADTLNELFEIPEGAEIVLSGSLTKPSDTEWHKARIGIV